MASTFLTRTIATATSTKIGTFSCWVKRANLTDGRMFSSWGSGTSQFWIIFQSDKISIADYDGSYNLQYVTNRLFRDTSAWYHILVAFDTTQGTSGDRVKLYVNGVQETSFSTSTAPSQNQVLNFSNSGEEFRIGKRDSEEYLDGLMSHIHFVDGTALTPATFGETDSTSGIWKPKASPSGITYGNNGFFLKFENSGAMGTDSSGESNTFTVSGTLTQNTDTPTNNFTVLNAVNNGAAASTLTNGNLTYSLSNYSHNTRSTMALTAGKWYWEQKISDNNTRIGLCTSGFRNDLDTDSTDAIIGGAGNGGLFLIMSNSSTSWQLTNNNTSRSVTTYTNAIASSANDILMGAVDVDAGKLWIGVNGTWFNSGNPATAATPTLTFTNNGTDPLQVYAGFGTDSARVVHYNFGSGYFGTTAVASANADANGHGKMEYALPSGFYTICTKNIKEFG